MVAFRAVSWNVSNELPLDRDARRQESPESPSLADIVVGVTAKAVVASLGEGVAASSFLKVKAYVQRLEDLAAYAHAANAAGAFTEASIHQMACRCLTAVGGQGGNYPPVIFRTAIPMFR